MFNVEDDKNQHDQNNIKRDHIVQTVGQGVHVHQTVKLQIHVWCLNIISICFKSICKNLTFRESTDNIERPCLDIEAAEKLWKAQQRKQRRNPVIEETPKRVPPQYGRCLVPEAGNLEQVSS